MEDGISGGLQYRHETCCEKGCCRGRRACMVRKWFHCRDVVSRQVDLHMTLWKTRYLSYYITATETYCKKNGYYEK